MRPAGISRETGPGEQLGATLVEFAVVFPIFLLFVLGVIDFSLIIRGYVMFGNEMRIAAREAMLGDSPITANSDSCGDSDSDAEEGAPTCASRVGNWLESRLDDDSGVLANIRYRPSISGEPTCEKVDLNNGGSVCKIVVRGSTPCGWCGLGFTSSDDRRFHFGRTIVLPIEKSDAC